MTMSTSKRKMALFRLEVKKCWRCQQILMTVWHQKFITSDGRNISRLKALAFSCPLSLALFSSTLITSGMRGRRQALEKLKALVSFQYGAQVSGGEARRLLPPGSFLKFYDQSFTGEEFKRVSSEGVFHQVSPPYHLLFELMHMSQLN